MRSNWKNTVGDYLRASWGVFQWAIIALGILVAVWAAMVDKYDLAIFTILCVIYLRIDREFKS